jgi:hypothetical protein
VAGVAHRYKSRAIFKDKMVKRGFASLIFKYIGDSLTLKMQMKQVGTVVHFNSKWELHQLTI